MLIFILNLVYVNAFLVFFTMNLFFLTLEVSRVKNGSTPKPVYIVDSEEEDRDVPEVNALAKTSMCLSKKRV